MARLAFVCLSLSLTLTIVQAQQPAAPQRGGQTPAAPTGPLAPEKYKDIKVLTDIPADQLDVTMRYIAAATGFQCQGCHVRDQATGEFAYEQDTRTKTTARAMMNLVKTVNAGDFGARINCGTCHGGQNRPAGLQLAQMMTPDQLAQLAAQQAARQGGAGGGAVGGAPAGGAPGGAGRGQQPALPAVDEIVTKYLDALGGAAALAKVQSRTITGTLTNRAAQSMAFTIEEKGNKFRETVQTQPDAASRGFDGTTGWAQGGTRVVDLTGFPLQQALRNADLMLPLQLKEKYQNLAAARVGFPPTTPGGTLTPVIGLRGNPAPNVTETLIFDATSGLLLRRTVRTATQLNGALNEQFDYSDYRTVGGVKMPFVIKRTNWNTLDTLNVADIKINPTIDDARFARPK